MDENYIRIAAYGVIALFFLLQWFMSVRPWFIWGLILPLLFGGAWYCVAAQPLFFADLGFTPDAVEVMSYYCKLGIIASLALFLICRFLRFLRRRHKAKKREQRLEEKRQRQAEEALSATQMLNQEMLAAAAAQAQAAGAEGDAPQGDATSNYGYFE